MCLAFNMNKVNGCIYSEQAVGGEVEVRKGSLTEESQVCDTFLASFLLFLSQFTSRAAFLFVVGPLPCSSLS